MLQGEVLTNDGASPQNLSWGAGPSTSWAVCNVGQASFELLGSGLPSAANMFRIGHSTGGWNGSGWDLDTSLATATLGDTLPLARMNSCFTLPVEVGVGTAFTKVRVCGMYYAAVNGLMGPLQILEVVVKMIHCDQSHNTGEEGGDFWNVEDLLACENFGWTTPPGINSYQCFDCEAPIEGPYDPCTTFMVVGFRDVNGNWSTVNDRCTFRLDLIP